MYSAPVSIIRSTSSTPECGASYGRGMRSTFAGMSFLSMTNSAAEMSIITIKCPILYIGQSMAKIIQLSAIT